MGDRKEGKKGGRKNDLKDEDEEVVDDLVGGKEEGVDAPVINFGGKKKAKRIKSGGSSMNRSSAFGLLGEAEENDDQEIEDNDDVDEEVDAKSKKSVGVSSAFDLFENESSKEEVEALITFIVTGKKSTGADTTLETTKSDSWDQHQDTMKKKKGWKTLQEEDDLDQFLAEFGEAPPAPPHVSNAASLPSQDQPDTEESERPDTSKNKYERKKGGKSPQEEEDFDQVLAEFGAALSVPTGASLEVEVQDQPGQEEATDDKEAEEGIIESASADVKLPGKSAFLGVEVDSEPEPLLKKEPKNARASTQDVEVTSAAAKPASVVPVKSQNAKWNSTAEGDDQKTNKIPDKKSKILNASGEKKKQHLRSPICCIMGHVDSGKTKLLDCIRGTNVQEGEAGGITQQIGATYIPAENILERTRELKADAKLDVPGLLVIDTPGHESFKYLRSRGSGLCDIAILVVDIMRGVEPQTIESLNLLRMRKTKFIIALTKVDKLCGRKKRDNAPIGVEEIINEFNSRTTKIITQFKEQGLNTGLYDNKDRGEFFNIVPTSALSGEGIPELLLLLIQWARETMVKRLTYSEKVQCTVLEVEVIEGRDTTIYVILVSGVLHEGDQIVVCGLQGPIVATIRDLFIPMPMRQLCVKGTYQQSEEIKAAQGIKITAQGLEHAIAGASLYVVGPCDDLEEIKESAMEDMMLVMSRIDISGEGVHVQASTLGSLEALLEFLKTPAVNIPVSGISLGPVHKKDVMKASVMLEKKKEYGIILAFDVKVTPETHQLAEELGVKIFIADVIYHLFDQFKAYIFNLEGERRKEAAEGAVFPCILKIMPNCVFNKDPIVLGVDVLEGILKVGTPICLPQRDFIEIGHIASVESNHKPVDYAKKGQKVAIKIISYNSDEQQKMVEDVLMSKISRHSLDILKENHADDYLLKKSIYLLN